MNDKRDGLATGNNYAVGDDNAQFLSLRGGDDTLFATADGKVKFGSRHGKKLVNVIPES